MIITGRYNYIVAIFPYLLNRYFVIYTALKFFFFNTMSDMSSLRYFFVSYSGRFNIAKKKKQLLDFDVSLQTIRKKHLLYKCGNRYVMNIIGIFFSFFAKYHSVLSVHQKLYMWRSSGYFERPGRQ